MADELADLVGQKEIDAALKSREVKDALIEFAEEARDYWKSVSPVGDESTDPHSGEYRDSIEVTVDGDKMWVGTEVEYAHIIEYGSVDTPEFAPRAKTEAHFG